MTPSHTVRIVDLGFAVARVKRDTSLANPLITLTLMTPANSEDGNYYQPAQSCEAFMSRDKVKALIEALSDEKQLKGDQS